VTVLSLIMSHCTYNVYMTPMYWMCCEYTYIRTYMHTGRLVPNINGTPCRPKL